MVLRKRIKVFKAIPAVLLLLLFSYQLFTKAAYQHTHISPDGNLVTHAHPYNKSADNQPLKQHFHSGVELALLQAIEVSFLLSFACLAIFFTLRKQHFRLPKHLLFNRNSFFLLPLRAPPVG